MSSKYFRNPISPEGVDYFPSIEGFISCRQATFSNNRLYADNRSSIYTKTTILSKTSGLNLLPLRKRAPAYTVSFLLPRKDDAKLLKKILLFPDYAR